MTVFLLSERPFVGQPPQFVKVLPPCFLTYLNHIGNGFGTETRHAIVAKVRIDVDIGELAVLVVTLEIGTLHQPAHHSSQSP